MSLDKPLLVKVFAMSSDHWPMIAGVGAGVAAAAAVGQMVVAAVALGQQDAGQEHTVSSRTPDAY